MDILKNIAPILIGAVIGYFTNFIAIKMLFHPRKAVKIGGVTLPFTPGVIPKNQPRIAHAIGEAVGETLLTQEDMMAVLKAESMVDNISEKAANTFCSNDKTMNDFLGWVDPEGTLQVAERLNDTVIRKMKDGLVALDYEKLMLETVCPTILEKVKGTMMAMFINENLVTSFSEPVGKYMKHYMEENGEAVLRPIVEEKMEEMRTKTLSETTLDLQISKEEVKEISGKMYQIIAEDKLPSAMKYLNISSIVEQKINEMNVKELEDLVFSVMKSELQTVINLGALIGAVIAALNLLL